MNIKTTLIASFVAILLSACTMQDPGVQERALTGAAIGAVLGATTGNTENVVVGAIAGGLAGALTYGQRPEVGASQCHRQYAGNVRAINACLEGVERGRVQQAREVGRAPNSTYRTCMERYVGNAREVCLREVDNRLARQQRALERDARRSGQTFGYNM